ncbi:hypothetical protein Nepgr_020085 [Nepenthes gracilis]|uniref:Uncharacterized protein n=1 Tax=Nepenthes gracilis TaxID=150966 RepID=A0AAD3SX01_NEPGR|nr:hypothetical protein Nepgr_020085 [Nepenthes gracilis]
MLLCPWRWSAPFPSRNLVYSAAATAISSLFKVRPSFLSPGLPSQSNTPKALSYHLASTPFMSSNDGGRSLRRSMPHSTPTLSTRCIAAKGEESNECGKFARYYRSLCPGEWRSPQDTLYLHSIIINVVRSKLIASLDAARCVDRSHLVR